MEHDYSLRYKQKILKKCAFLQECYRKFYLYFQSYDIVDCTFSTPWYLMKSKFRGYLSLMIARAQNPPILTAGKLLPINFSAYLKVRLEVNLIFC